MLRSAWRFRKFLRRFTPALGWGALLVVLDTLTDLAQPWPLKVIVDGAILHKPQTGWLPTLIAGPNTGPNVWNGRDWIIVTPAQTILVRAVIATLILVCLAAIFDYSSDMLMDRAGEKVVVQLRRAMYAHLQRLSLGFHDQQRVGDLVSRVTLDVDRVQSMLVAIFDTFIPNMVMLVGLAVVMLWVDPGFGLIALAIAPPLFVVTYRYTMQIKLAARRAREADAKIAAHANETLSAVRSVQAFHREDYEDDRFAERNSESLTASLEAVRLRAMFTPIVDIVSLGGTLLVTYVGARRVIDGSMSLGIFLVFLSYLKSLYRPMRALSKMTYVVSRGTTSAERVQQILEIEDRIPQADDPVVLDPVRGSVELRDVTFRYAEGLAPVLEHASLRIEPGEHVGVVGRTGAGKSTIISLISRFYDVDGGAVLIDGVDVRALDIGSLRRQVSIVLQDPVLFFGTILDNIRYGDPDAPIDKILAAADAAHVTEFLDRLPKGIDTELGERGTKLSGGQRQRVAIARAILADAPILILDEPTTGLDTESEAYVLDGLERLSAGRTTIVISHHAAALRGVTRVLHVAHGSIDELPSVGAPGVVLTGNGNGREPGNGSGQGNGIGDAESGANAAERGDGEPGELELLADATDERTFSTIADGYAPHEVRAFLAELSDRLRDGAERERRLRELLERSTAQSDLSNGEEASTAAAEERS